MPGERERLNKHMMCAETLKKRRLPDMDGRKCFLQNGCQNGCGLQPCWDSKGKDNFVCFADDETVAWASSHIVAQDVMEGGKCSG